MSGEPRAEPASRLTVGIDYRPALQNREGIGRYTRELSRALASLPGGPRLALYASTFAPARVPPPDPPLPGARLRRWRLPTRAQHAWLRLTSGADGFLGGTDVFHHTQYHRLPVSRAAEVATLHDCIYVHQPEWVGAAAAAVMERRARSLVTGARRVLVPSEFVRGEVSETFGVAPERISVTPLGCDHVRPSQTRRPARDPDTSHVLTVSRIDVRKNHVRMLRAFEGLVAAGLPQRWVVVGPPGHGAEGFRAALARSPARERVDVLGQVDEPRLAALLAGADVFLFTSLAEGFGLPPLEAMAAGVPVVASATTSVGEVCAGGALLVDPEDVEATRGALCTLAGDAAERERWAARARERAARFTWRRCAEATLAAYEAAARA